MKLGAQLFTLRHYTQNEKDFRFSMEKIAKIGYDSVQISAVGPIPAQRIREICDDNGLEIVLTHINPDRILNDTSAVIKEHEIMGCKYIGMGAMPEKYRNEYWVDRFAEDYRQAAKDIASNGMLFMYHNHDFEFELANGKRIFDRLLEYFTAQEMGITLDTYWVQAAGGDVLLWIDKLKDRIPCVHLKDMDIRGGKSVMAPVGEGNMNFEGILKRLAEHGTTEHILVEQDNYLESPFVCLEKSYKYVRSLGY